MNSTLRTIEVNALARVEGEGALYLKIENEVVKEVKFRIFEPPRFFEAFLRGRNYLETPDIVSRICGICPIAYIMGATQSMENILDLVVLDEIAELRRMIYCAEWIESHVLHAAMLHAPDFIGLDDAMQIAKANPELVKNALRLKKIGNQIMGVIGGRAVHSVNMRVGGFYKAPSEDKIKELIPSIEWAIDAAIAITKEFAKFHFPDFEQDYHFVSLGGVDEYPIINGKIISNLGLSIKKEEFFNYFVEEHVEHSNALHGRMKKDNSAYLLGPLSRFNNNFEKLTPKAKKLAMEIGLGKGCKNPYKSILVRMIETTFAFEECLRIAKNYQEPAVAYYEAKVKAGVGFGATEAPRGICYHSYEIDDAGLVKKATILAPTSQNQPQIEADLLKVAAENINLNDEKLKMLCEQTIRNYDPCISCSAHFLDFKVERE